MSSFVFGVLIKTNTRSLSHSLVYAVVSYKQSLLRRLASLRCSTHTRYAHDKMQTSHPHCVCSLTSRCTLIYAKVIDSTERHTNNAGDRDESSSYITRTHDNTFTWLPLLLLSVVDGCGATGAYVTELYCYS